MSRISHKIQFPTSDGLQLAGIVEVPPGERIGTILFSHCFTCSKDLKAIVRVSRALASLGWIVLRYDFRGIGNSEGDFAQSNFSTNLEDLRSAARFLDVEYDGADFLMGHSFGGAASLAAAQSMESLFGVIALAAPSDTQHLASLLESMDPQIFQTGSGTVTIGGTEFQIERQMLDDFRSYDLADIVSKLEKPLLALHSPTDETVAYENALRNCDFANARQRPLSPRSLITLPGFNHLLTDDSQCQLVASHIHHWCSSLSEK